MESHLRFVGLMRWLLLPLLVVTGGVEAEPQPLPLVITPAQGAHVTSGESFTLNIGATGVSALHVSINVVGQSSEIEQSGPVPLAIPITVPSGLTGPFRMLIDAYSYDAQTGTVYQSTTQHEVLAVPPAGQIPQSLELSGYHLRLNAPTQGGSAETEAINPMAIYADGSFHNVGLAAFGTTYVSSDPAVATVSADGLVTAVSPGIAFVRVDYGSLQTFAEVKVTGTVPLAIVEYTSQIPVSASGFRRELATGWYTQQVTFTNTTAWPIPRPIHLVVSGLPEGVWMPQNRDLTKTVQPLGSPTVHVVPPGDGEFLVPGATATAILKFENTMNLPITHTVRLFGGAIP